MIQGNVFYIYLLKVNKLNYVDNFILKLYTYLKLKY